MYLIEGWNVIDYVVINRSISFPIDSYLFKILIIRSNTRIFRKWQDFFDIIKGNIVKFGRINKDYGIFIYIRSLDANLIFIFFTL